jgi:hypothetical protein
MPVLNLKSAVSQYRGRVFLACLATFLLVSTSQAQSLFDPDRDHEPLSKESIQLTGLTTVDAGLWNTVAIRRILQAFAYGGRASDLQISRWANMAPEKAITEILNFDLENPGLLAEGDGNSSAISCDSLTELQYLWGSDEASNPVRASERRFYSILGPNGRVQPLSLYFAWSRAMYTQGCNQFLHKMAFYLTNYHASIHIQNTGPSLIRDYYDDTVKALNNGDDFIGLMFQAAKNGALSFAYGHASNFVHPVTGEFSGNDDFAREYFQLLFGIEGTSEDTEYHEGVSIENNARLLTGMAPDLQVDRFGSASRLDWLISDIDFSDHVDSTGRRVFNRSLHFDFRLGAASCLEILHEQICGETAEEKLRALGSVAASHPESMSSVPLKLVRFFADTVITPVESQALQLAWDDADFDLLRFIRAYAISTQFHDPSTWKYWSAFERNLIIHNAVVLDNEESFARSVFTDPLVRMSQQGAIPFAPIRDVFGGQTGNDAGNDRFVFKNAWSANVGFPDVLAANSQVLSRDDNGNVNRWIKDWASVIPVNQHNEYRVEQVAEWLWNRLIADGGQNFDRMARAQVYSLLVTGFDFGLLLESEERSAVTSMADLEPGTIAGAYYDVLANSQLDLSQPRQQHNVGMAINFISMLPSAFGAGGLNP